MSIQNLQDGSDQLASIKGMDLYSCLSSAIIMVTFRCSGRAMTWAGPGLWPRSIVSLLSLLPSIFFLHSTKQHKCLLLQNVNAATTCNLGYRLFWYTWKPSCYYDCLCLSMLLPENSYHVLRAQLTLPSDVTQQNCPFAGTAFTFSLSSSSSGICLYMWEKNTETIVFCKSDSCSDELRYLNVWANLHWSTECLSAVIFVILLFMCCLATAEGVCRRAVLSWCMLYLTVVHGHSGGKEQRSPAGIVSSEVFELPQ